MPENFISNENFIILKEANLVQAVSMACEILKKDVNRSGYEDFEKELTKLTKKIVEEKIELLRTYLK